MRLKILIWTIAILLLVQFVHADDILEVYFNNIGNETLMDAYTSESAKDTIYNNAELYVATKTYESYVMWVLNTSMFPEGTEVHECYANFTISTSEGDTYNDIRAIYVNTTNATFDETTLTYNNAPCTTDASACDQTALDTITIPGSTSGMYSFNVTKACRYAIGNQTNNITIIFGNSSTNGENQAFHSKDSGQAAVNLPGLQILYTMGAEEGLQQFTVTAKDEYDSSALSNITLKIFNSSNEYTFSTENGTIYIQNRTIGRFGVFYEVNITSNQSNGYFNMTYNNINISDGGSNQFNIVQSYISINVTDLISGEVLSSFTVGTNYSSHDGTNGNILLPTKNGEYHIFNITSSQYPVQEYSYAIGVLENLSFYANISPIYNFYLRREADNSVFDIESTNSTRLTIYCPNKNIVVTFRNNSYNSTEENTTVDCQFTHMKMDVNFDGSTYFRTLIPETSQQNVTWWLLDLNKDTGVQKIVELVDLTGEWTNGIVRITKGIADTVEDIIEQYLDVSASVNLYLLKDSIYTLVLENNDGTEERQLGTLIADTAGTVTVTYPNIKFYPSTSILEDNISWSYTCPFSQCNPPYNTSDMLLRLRYIDQTGETSSIRWTIYNGTNGSTILYTFTSTSSDVTFTYQPVILNMTYITNLFVQHNLLDFNITDTRTFGDIVEPTMPGYTEEEEDNIKKYAAGIFIILVGLVFSAYHSGIGLALAFVLTLIFRAKGYIDINYVWLSLMGFAAIIAFIYESMKKD